MRLRSHPFVLFFPVVLLALSGRLMGGNVTNGMKEDIYRLREFFDTTLPGTLKENNLTLHFTPKFVDFRDQEYIRYPIELRYGLNERWELSTGLVPFGPNPFHRGHDHRWGPGEMKLGARYDLGPMFNFFDASTLGLEVRVPAGKPPTSLNDHFTHVKPIVAASRELQRWPDVTFYTNLSYDRSVILTKRGTPPPEVVRRNIIDVWPGFLYKPSEFAYFTEYRFSHISEPVSWHLAHETRIGTIWDVPLRRTVKWKLPGKWQLELAYIVRHEESLATEQSVALRVNWRTSLREVMARYHPPANAFNAIDRESLSAR